MKQSSWISPLKVGVEQSVVLLKRGFLQQTSSKPTAPCYLNEVFQGVQFFSRVNESYLLHVLYFCAKKQLCLYLLPHCLTGRTVTAETGFQGEGQSLPAWKLRCLWRETDLWACGLLGNTGIPDYISFNMRAMKAFLSTRLTEKQFFSAFFFSFSCFCFLLVMSLYHFSLAACPRRILKSFFMSDAWSHQWKSLSGTQVGKSYMLHYASMVGYSKSPFEGLRNL